MRILLINIRTFQIKTGLGMATYFLMNHRFFHFGWMYKSVF